MTSLLVLAVLNSASPVFASGSGDPPAATGQSVAPPASLAPTDRVVTPSPNPPASQGFKRAAKLHALSTHDLTYWGLPLGQGLASMLLGLFLHKRAVDAQAKLYPNHSTGLVTLWGASLAAHLVCAAPVISLFVFWFAATDTTTHAEFMKRASTAFGAELLALVLPPVIWIGLTLMSPPRLEARGSARRSAS